MSDERAPRRALLATTGAALLLAVLLVRPFWQALLVAAVLAAVLRPAMEWLATRMGRRRHLAGVLLTLAVLVAVAIPVGTLATILVTEAIDGFAWLRAAVESQGVAGLVDRMPAALRPLAEQLLASITEAQAEFLGLVGARGGQAAAAFGSFLAATGGALLHAAVGLVAFYFLLVDGTRLVGWAEETFPLPPGQVRATLLEFRATARAVLLSTLGTAALQAVAGMVGFAVARVPTVTLLTFMTFVVALVPAVGGTVVVIATGLVQMALGHLVSGFFLVAWGVGVVSTVDTFARPWLMRGGMALHGGIIAFALLGGIAAFGPIGVLLGPLTVTFLLAVVRMWKGASTAT